MTRKMKDIDCLAIDIDLYDDNDQALSEATKRCRVQEVDLKRYVNGIYHPERIFASFPCWDEVVDRHLAE